MEQTANMNHLFA